VIALAYYWRLAQDCLVWAQSIDSGHCVTGGWAWVTYAVALPI
jgi:hypothetical protein